MKRLTLPTQETLKELYDYNEITGAITNKKTGFILGSRAKKKRDYINIKIDGKIYLAQRVIWKLMTGEEPNEVIDHINRDKRDNSWNNLRDVTWGDNQRNADYLNIRGKGYSYYKRTGKWQVQVRYDNTLHYLGFYDTETDAIQVVKEFKSTHH